MKTDYVDCPICGQSDMPKELEPGADVPGQGYIKCLNLACASNGGTNMCALPQSKDIDWAMLIKERGDADRELVEGLKEIREVLKPEIGRLERQFRRCQETKDEAQLQLSHARNRIDSLEHELARVKEALALTGWKIHDPVQK